MEGGGGGFRPGGIVFGALVLILRSDEVEAVSGFVSTVPPSLFQAAQGGVSGKQVS